MIILRRALQRLSLLGLIASPFLSPVAADAITGVGKFGRSEERSLISLTDPSLASAFILGKPGTSSALGFTAKNCDTNAMLTMVRLDLTSSYQMWKYDASTSSIQSIACPNKVITIIPNSNSSCASIQVTAKVSDANNIQSFSFENIANFSDDETAGVRIKSSALGCDNKVLSDGGSDGSIGYTIIMRENNNDNWLFIDLSIGNNYFHLLRDYISENVDPTYAASISMSTNGSRIAISGSESDSSGSDVFSGFVKIFDADTDGVFGKVTTDSIEGVAPIVNVVLSGDGNTLAVGAVFPTNGINSTGGSLSSGVKVFDLTTKDDIKQIGATIAAGAMGDLPGLRLDMSDDGSTLVVGGRNYDDGRGQVRLFSIDTTNPTNIIIQETLQLQGANGSKDHLGSSVSLSGNGKYVAIGGTGVTNNDPSNPSMAGAVTVYAISTTPHVMVGGVIYGTSENDATGFSVDLVETDNMLYAAVASIFVDTDKNNVDRGKVEIFAFSKLASDAVWVKLGKSLVGDRGATLDFLEGKYHIGDSFGFSLGLAKMNDGTGGLRVAVGSPFFSNIRESDAYYGVVKLFEYNAAATEWEQIAYDVVGNTKTSASGTSIALVNGGDTLAIGGGSDGASNGKVVVYAQEETSSQPSSVPSVVPSKEPSSQPSSVPSSQPSSIPSKEPSSIPSSPPSSVPSREPSSVPSSAPSSAPSSQPSSVPSKAPSGVPSNIPSSQPSSVPSEKPSSIPSSVPSSQPSFVPSQHPSNIPSTRPSVSHEPSSQPSDFGAREFMILSKFKKFTDLDMGERNDKNWCLERLMFSNADSGSPLKMRPCETGSIKQMWVFDKQVGVIKSENNGFFIARDGKQLVSKPFSEEVPDVTTSISEGALNLTQDGSRTGWISMKTARNNEFYFAIDSIRIFSRVKLLKRGTENSSYDKWQLRYHGPSEFPSSIPSSNPSKKPSTGPSREPSQGPSREPSQGPSMEPTTEDYRLSLKTIGEDPTGPLDICTGDCDTDADCKAGLVCYRRDGGTVPGCIGDAPDEYDYCVDPSETGNIARLPSATKWHSSDPTGYPKTADRATDGDTSGVWDNGSVTHTRGEDSPSWHVTWPAAHRISRIKVWNRTDKNCWNSSTGNDCGNRLINFVLTIYLDGNIMWSSILDSSVDTSTNKVMYDFDDIPSYIVGDKVEVRIPPQGSLRHLSLAEVEVFGDSREIYNVARNKYTEQSSDYRVETRSENAVDGEVRPETEFGTYFNHVSITRNTEASPDWHVLLGNPVVIDRVVIYNRVGGTTARLRGFRMEIFNEVNGFESVVHTYNDPTPHPPAGPGLVIPLDIPADIVGTKVRISLPGKTQFLQLREVQVFSRVGCFDVDGDASNRVCQAPSLKVAYYKDNLDADGLVYKGYTNVLLPVNGLLSLDPYKTDHDFGGSAINFNNGSLEVLNSGLVDDVALRFVGYAIFDDVGGTYQICTNSDDQSKVYIDGKLIVEAYHDEGTKCGDMTNEIAGVKRVAVEFKEGGEGASCHIEWTPPNGNNRVDLPFISALGCSFWDPRCWIKEATCSVCKKAVPLLLDFDSEAACDIGCVGIAESVGGGPEDPAADAVAAACVPLCTDLFAAGVTKSASVVCGSAGLC